MDGDSSQKEAIHRNHGAYDSNLFQSSWFRRLVQTSNGLDKFLLDYGFNFLPGLSLLFWFVFLFAKM